MGSIECKYCNEVMKVEFLREHTNKLHRANCMQCGKWFTANSNVEPFCTDVCTFAYQDTKQED